MKKLFSLMFVVFAILVLAIPAEAQWRSPAAESLSNAVVYGPGGGGVYGGNYGRRGYGYYDPATMQQMLSLPQALVACTVDFSTGKVLACRPIVKSAMAINAFGENHGQSELLGTVHVEKGKFHFFVADDTSRRIGTGMGGALGAAGGAAIGGAFGGRRGAALLGVGGAIAGGLLGSRRSHNSCLIIEPETAREAGVAQSATQSSSETIQASQSVPTPADPLAGITWQTVNSTDFRAVVTDPNTGQKRLIPVRGSVSLPEPSGDQPYVVVLLAPGQGKIDQVPGEIRPSQDLQGWEIVAK